MEILSFADAAAWESWLAGHHDRADEAWLRIARKGRAGLTIVEALDVALCFGWIDSQRRAHDDGYFLQRYSRRRPRSPWSKVNVDKVEALIAAGRLRAPGLAEVEAAKADGRWDTAYESQRNATVPDDLAAALAANDRARGHFESLGKTGRYLAILPLLKAKGPEDRAGRLRKVVARLEAGEEVG